MRFCNDVACSSGIGRVRTNVGWCCYGESVGVLLGRRKRRTLSAGIPYRQPPSRSPLFEAMPSGRTTGTERSAPGGAYMGSLATDSISSAARISSANWSVAGAGLSSQGEVRPQEEILLHAPLIRHAAL